jgi:intein/homing endonuclease
VWTDSGWSKIKKVMRHKTDKKLYRVITHTGIVDVTEDHSLLNEFGKEVKPSEVGEGTKLFHKDLPNVQFYNPNMDEEKAWVWGFFMAEGSCGSYKYARGVKNVWAISNQNQDFLNKAQRIMRRIEPDYDFIIDPCMKSSNVDKLNVRGKKLGEFVKKYDRLFYTARSKIMRQNIATTNGIRFKKVPDEIIMASNDIKHAFLQGFYDGDGSKTEGNSRRFDLKGQIGTAGLFYLAAAIEFKVSLNDKKKKQEVYRCTLTTNKQRRHPDEIKKIIELPNDGEYVYDLETENHHFAAGPGRMVVHNSCMIDLNIKDIKECQKWGETLAQEISGVKAGDPLPGVVKNPLTNAYDEDAVHKVDIPGLFPPPLRMEFEKAMRLLCFKKKKYAALLIDKKGNFKKIPIRDKNGNVIGYTDKYDILKKGIVLARRDNCFTGDTLVTLANGTSLPIKNLVNNKKVFGWNGKGLVTENQTDFKYQGKQKCITINVMDGRKITCTPDHRLLVKLEDDSIIWKEAKDINIATDKLVCGLESPEDKCYEDEAGWSLNINSVEFDMKDGRDKTLAFARLLGYSSDNLIVNHKFDVDAIIDDIKLISDVTPQIKKLQQGYQIQMPITLMKLFETKFAKF